LRHYDDFPTVNSPSDVDGSRKMSDRVLSQQEIDRVFRSVKPSDPQDELANLAVPYDFRRPDRIAKDQLRSIHMLHETFARALGPSLSAFLRAYVVVNLVSVEQLAFVEFSRSLPSPSCMIKLGMTGFDNNAIFEMNPSLVFPILEMLLGNPTPGRAAPDREITEIERAVLDGVIRLVLKDMKESWRAYIPNMDFAINGYETEPQLLQILSPNEAVVAVSIEIRAGEISGMMNIGIPSIIIKMLGQRLEQHGVRRAELSDEESARIMQLVAPAALRMDTRLNGPMLTVRDLLALKSGDVLTFDYPLDRPIHVTINGCSKFSGHVVAAGRKRSVKLDDLAAVESLA